MKTQTTLVRAAIAALALSPLATASARELACIGVSAQAIYRNYGYDHIVHLVSRCPGEAACDVSTDVNPDPIHVTVPAGGSVEVLTFRGSPARTFTPRVSCHSSH